MKFCQNIQLTVGWFLMTREMMKRVDDDEAKAVIEGETN